MWSQAKGSVLCLNGAQKDVEAGEGAHVSRGGTKSSEVPALFINTSRP